MCNNITCKLAICFFPLIVALGLFTCAEQHGIDDIDDIDDSGERDTVSIYLTDAPCYDYLKLNVELLDVQINEREDGASGWLPTNVNKGIYNILELNNGKEALIAKVAVKKGNKVSRVRLVFGTNNSLQYFPQPPNNNVHESEIRPNGSALTKEVKVDIDLTKTTRILLDFDVSKSIYAIFGTFQFQPSIRYVNELETGSIKGVIPSHRSGMFVAVIAGPDTIGSYANQDGEFLIRGIKPGTCRLLIPTKGEYSAKKLENLKIEANQTNDLGQIAFEMQPAPYNTVLTSLNYNWNKLQTKVSDDGNFFLLTVSFCPLLCPFLNVEGPYRCDYYSAREIVFYIEKSKIASNIVISLNNGVPYAEPRVHPTNGSYLVYKFLIPDPPRGEFVYADGSITINDVVDGRLFGTFTANKAGEGGHHPSTITGEFKGVPLDPTDITVN